MLLGFIHFSSIRYLETVSRAASPNLFPGGLGIMADD